MQRTLLCNFAFVASARKQPWRLFPPPTMGSEHGLKNAAVFWTRNWADKSEGRQSAFTFVDPVWCPENGRVFEAVPWGHAWRWRKCASLVWCQCHAGEAEVKCFLAEPAACQSFGSPWLRRRGQARIFGSKASVQAASVQETQGTVVLNIPQRCKKLTRNEPAAFHDSDLMHYVIQSSRAATGGVWWLGWQPGQTGRKGQPAHASHLLACSIADAHDMARVMGTDKFPRPLRPLVEVLFAVRGQSCGCFRAPRIRKLFRESFEYCSAVRE